MRGEMLILLIVATFLGSLAIEWTLNHISDDQEPKQAFGATMRLRRLALSPNPATLHKAERQMNEPFNEASEGLGLK